MSSGHRSATLERSPADQGAYDVTAVVPVKPLSLAKTRLTLPDDEREALALAFAVDTVTAVAGSPRVAGVLVVTSDPLVARRLARLPVRLAGDAGDGLGPAVRAGIRVATAWKPGTGVVVVPADLPCLRPDDVTLVVTRAAAIGGAFVPDRASSGTTLLVSPPGRTAVTHYGPDSAARHRSAGVQALEDAPLRARHDVDTLDDLTAAVALGLGPETAAAMPG